MADARPRRGRAGGPLPRGICPECDNEYALRGTGTLGQHKRRTRQGYRIGDCSGVDQLPVSTTPPKEAPQWTSD